MAISANQTADKYAAAMKERKDLEEQAEKDKLVKKEATLVIRKVKNNMALVQPYRIFPKSSNILVPGKPHFNMKEETIYEVKLVGKLTDDYMTEVKVGDLITVFRGETIKHNATTDARFPDGSYAGLYDLISLNDIAEIVDYKLK